MCLEEATAITAKQSSLLRCGPRCRRTTPWAFRPGREATREGQRTMRLKALETTGCEGVGGPGESSCRP